MLAGGCNQRFAVLLPVGVLLAIAPDLQLWHVKIGIARCAFSKDRKIYSLSGWPNLRGEIRATEFQPDSAPLVGSKRRISAAGLSGITGYQHAEGKGDQNLCGAHAADTPGSVLPGAKRIGLR